MMLRPNSVVPVSSEVLPLAAVPVPVPGGASSGSIDWAGWLRRTDRKRRLAGRGRAGAAPAEYFVNATYASFALAEMNIGPGQVVEAISANQSRRTFRSRQNQRIRNHVAILYQIENLLASAKALTSNIVLRWYTSISSGLSTAALDPSAAARLHDVVLDINFPHPRLRRALPHIATLHVSLLNVPLFPAFNSILARLLLRYHLGRHGLPAISLDPSVDRKCLVNPRHFLPLLMKQVESSLDSSLATGS